MEFEFRVCFRVGLKVQAKGFSCFLQQKVLKIMQAKCYTVLLRLACDLSQGGGIPAAGWNASSSKCKLMSSSNSGSIKQSI